MTAIKSDEAPQDVIEDQSMKRVIGSSAYFVKNGKIKRATLHTSPTSDARQQSLSDFDQIDPIDIGATSED